MGEEQMEENAEICRAAGRINEDDAPISPCGNSYTFSVSL